MLRTILIASTVLAGLASAVPAAAVITGGALTGGTAVTGTNPGSFLLIDPIPAGFAVGNDNFQDNNVRAFNELQGVATLGNFAVNVGSTIAAGTKINSHYLVFDPNGNRSVIGNITFATNVLGILTSRQRLLAGDIFGKPNVNYLLPNLRGLEAGDFVTFSGKTASFNFTASTPGDSIRIITAVPEPASWAMLVAGFGFIGASLRRRQRATSVLA